MNDDVEPKSQADRVELPEDISERPADVLAARYRLDSYLGRGGTSDVWAAHDTLTDTDVALKLLRACDSVEPARIRREVMTLRMLRIRGVVELRDEGEYNGRPFIVMNRVSGSPFPGLPLPCSWSSVAPRVVAILEILDRIHHEGIVHRDIKPQNILVDERGAPTYLDFGLAYSSTLGKGLTEDHHILGTPEYFAPEQILGEEPTPQTDLYAIGVVLYEVLTGRLPHPTSTRRDLYTSRLGGHHAHLRDIVSDVPPYVADLVHRLLEVKPANRPGSVSEVLAIVNGHVPGPVDPWLPWLGPRTPIDTLVQASRRSISMDVIGSSGMGRKRCLWEAATLIEAEGWHIEWLPRARRAFGSIEPLVQPVANLLPSNLDSMIESSVAHIGHLLRSGTIIIADDYDGIDKWSRLVLERCLQQGSVFRSFAPTSLPPSARRIQAIELGPLTERDLDVLFDAPNRFFHVREDAARLLWSRTEGHPERVTAELNSWEREGLIRRQDSTFVITRNALDRMSSPFALDHSPSITTSPTPDPNLPAHLTDLVETVALIAPHATTALIAEVIAQPRWRVEADIADLLERGYVRQGINGLVEPELQRSFMTSWPTERRRSVRATVAGLLPRGSDGRLLHLVAAAPDFDPVVAREIVIEAHATAERFCLEGQHGHAIRALSSGLSAALRCGLSPSPIDIDYVVRLFSLWARIALVDNTPLDINRVLYEIARIRYHQDSLDMLQRLLLGALAIHRGDETALDLLDAIPAFSDETLERLRQGSRVLAAARRQQPALDADIVSQAATWAAQSKDSATLASMYAWLGGLRYREGKFLEAARMRALGVEHEPWPLSRIAAQLNTASALLEAFMHQEAERWALEGRALAVTCRSPFYEMRAEWILRTTRYRRAIPLDVDDELLAAARTLGNSDMDAQICLTEAAIAFRQGKLDATRALASRARESWEPRNRWGRHFARSLELAAGAPAKRNEVIALAQASLECPIFGAGLQSLGLLANVLPTTHEWLERAQALFEQIPIELRDLRMDVLSANEAIQRLSARASIDDANVVEKVTRAKRKRMR